MRTRPLALLTLVLFLGGSVVVLCLVSLTLKPRIGPERVFELANCPKFLAEELALGESARNVAAGRLGCHSLEASDKRSDHSARR